MAPIRLGVIGLSANGGWAATSLIPPIFEPLLADKYKLTALCTSSEESAKEAATKYTTIAGHPVKGYFGSQGYRDIANDPEVDMVVVSVKIEEHAEPVLATIEAGKMLFVEWAPGKNLEETVKLAEAAKAKGVRSLVGTQGAYAAYPKKVKEIIDSGKIGRVLSTSLSGAGPYGGGISIPAMSRVFDINNGLTLLTVPIGHFLIILKDVLGTFTEVTALGSIRFPIVQVIGGEPITDRTTHDQVIVTGVLKSNVGTAHDGVVVNIHYQGGVVTHEPFLWSIFGETGTIEVKAAKDAPGDVMPTQEKDVYLNGVKVEVEETEVDKKLGNTGKGWLEFAEQSGRGVSLEDSVELYRVVDAALTSIREGRKVVL
ncbi:NAD(P)-binding protein [Trametopsis cervina]|nr:NAD(P)-binding protein [Trametopsis cervina]